MGVVGLGGPHWNKSHRVWGTRRGNSVGKEPWKNPIGKKGSGGKTP